MLLASGLAATLTLSITLYQPERPLSVLLIIGVLLGITLYQGRFGFASAYRNLFLYRDTRGVRAHLWMIALTTLLFAPVLAQGEFFGRQVHGALAPVGWQVACGAFFFGIGMQLAGGCGSGTLYTTGSGNPKMLLVLTAFCGGSFWASLDMNWWQQLPALPPIAMGVHISWPGAVIFQIGVFSLLALALKKYGINTFAGSSVSPPFQKPWHQRLIEPWPVFVAASLLALLNFATLATAGHPWTITWAFSLWGAKAATLLGWIPAENSFWTAPFQSSALLNSIFNDTTSVMNIGILLGAFCAAQLAKTFGSALSLSWKNYVAALIGGLLLGYGARIAFGCNIGALFSGIASTSLHGWLWMAAALPGNWLGIKLRPYFDLSN
ncbi:hypothetical protein BGP75_12215 [Motiliproteus sp. MSK22-1]|nr:hypothetical protein BGP75_12215 [Motiliproteus sp. MSK22-1]